MVEKISPRDKTIMVVPFLTILVCFIAGIGLLIHHIRTAGMALFPLINLVSGVISVVIGLSLLIKCLRYIPATPPNIGLVTIFGERKPKVLREGWHLLWPFFPFWYNAILVNVEKKNKDFHPKSVRTNEQVELEVEVSITYTPDKDNPKNTMKYINAGGKTGVENILDDIVEEQTREFAIKKTWVDCLAANEEIAKLLIEEIAGVTKEVGIKKIRRGDGIKKIPSLGIVLNRLNIGTIWVKGRLGEEAELKAREERHMEAERVEFQHVRDRAKEIKDVLGISGKDAIEVVQTERGKVTKTITEYKGLEKVKGLPLISIGGEVPPRVKRKKRGS